MPGSAASMPSAYLSVNGLRLPPGICIYRNIDIHIYILIIAIGSPVTALAALRKMAPLLRSQEYQLTRREMLCQQPCCEAGAEFY